MGRSKIYPDARAALVDVLTDGMTIASGGFGLCGIPENLIAAIQTLGARNLTFISNTAGVTDFGLGLLMQSRQIAKMICSYVGENDTFEELYMAGEIAIEFNPQGTLAERMRAGGSGIPAFYTKTGVGTLVAEGKEQRVFNGETYLMETALHADLAIIKAWKGDPYGNLIFRKSARNFNPMAAMCARVCVAEVEELIEPGSVEPDAFHLPGIYVDRLFQGAHFEKRIEHCMVREREVG